MTAFSAEEVSKHNTEDSTWIIIKGKVYDVTKFLNEHPGGDEVILEHAGKDASEPFDDVGHSRDALEMLVQYEIGTVAVEGATVTVLEPKATPPTTITVEEPAPTVPLVAPKVVTPPEPRSPGWKDIFRSTKWVEFGIPSALGCLVFSLYKMMPVF